MCIVPDNVHVQDRVDRVMTSRLTPIDARGHVCVCLYIYIRTHSLSFAKRERDSKIVHMENQVDSVDDIETHHMSTEMCVYVCIFIYTHTPSHAHTHTLLTSRHTTIDIYRYVCVCMYIHTYTHALSRTHTHTLTHIHADPDIVHVEDRVDPVDDIEIISNELRQKDLEAIERKLADLNRDKTRYTHIYESGSRPPPP